MNFKYQIFASSVFVVALSISATVLARPQSSVGEVQFENSGNAAAQAPFLRGLALLHNFEYDSAADAFRDAQAADPAFAMAYWGEAMTHNHPLWMEQDRDAAREALYRLGEDQESRLTKTKNQRERAYLGAIESLYGEGEKRLRDFAYADAMAALHEKYPDDVNATAFTALSILGTAHDGRDFAIYMRSAALLEEIFPENRTHPGVLHYLIHSYDDPIHAPLGLRAARRFGKVAPNASHALHMTSHIFVAGTNSYAKREVATKRGSTPERWRRVDAERGFRSVGDVKTRGRGCGRTGNVHRLTSCSTSMRHGLPYALALRFCFSTDEIHVQMRSIASVTRGQYLRRNNALSSRSLGSLSAACMASPPSKST